MTLDIQHMKACAEAATPGEWFPCDFRELASHPTIRDVSVSCSWPDYIGVCSMENALSATPKEALANAAHIAASSPANVLALIDAVDDFRIAAEASDAALVHTCENLTECRTALAAAEQRVKELEDGLRPFAHEAQFFTHPIHTNGYPYPGGDDDLTLGDFRRAAALLAEPQKESASDA